MNKTPIALGATQQKNGKVILNDSRVVYNETPSYDQWLTTNRERISQVQNDAACEWLGIDYLETDNRWHYSPNPETGKNDKRQGYLAEVSFEGNVPRLKVISNSFRHGGSKQSFNDLEIVSKLYQGEKLTFKRAKQATKTAKPEKQLSAQKALSLAKAAYENARASPQPHAYLAKKGISHLEGMRYGTDTYGNKNCLLIPITDVHGSFKNLQSIDAKGEKRFSKGLEVKGNCFIIGTLGKNTKRVFLCEGAITGVSINLATGDVVVCALNAENLDDVAKKLKLACPRLKIIVCADNDAYKPDVGNPGMTKAHSLALEMGLEVVSPSFTNTTSKPTDFNDLHTLEGLEVVKAQLANTGLANPMIAYEKELRGIINQHRYLPAIEAVEGITLIKSPQNTGKTHALKSLVAKSKAEGENILVISHLRSLVGDIARRLELTDYRSIKGSDIIRETALAICLNSLTRLVDRASGDELRNYHTVIIDEIEQLSRTLKSVHIKERQLILSVLVTIIQRAKRVILLDADLGQLTKAFIKCVRPHDKVKLIENNYQVAKELGKKAVIYQRKGEALRVGLNRLEQGKRVAFFCNSLADTEGVYSLITAKHPHLKGLLLNSETSSEHQHELTNMTEAVKNYDFVVASPSLQTGVSIEGSHIDVVIGLFHSVVGTAEDAVQQLWRVREATELHVWADPLKQSLPMNRNMLAATFGNTLKKERELMGLGETYGQINETYKALWIESTLTENLSKNGFRQNLIRLMVLQGFEASLNADKSEGTSGLEKGCKALGLELYANNRANAKDITATQAKALKDKTELTRAEGYELAKFHLKDFYRLTSDDDVKAWLIANNRGRLERKVENFELIFKSDDTLKAELLARAERSNLAGDIKFKAVKREFLRRVLESTGFANALEGQEHRYSKETLGALVEYIKANYEWLVGAFKSFPTLEKLAANPIQYVYGWLKQLGLKHKQVGKHQGPNKYTLDLEALESMRAIVKRRGVVDLDKGIPSFSYEASNSRVAPEKPLEIDSSATYESRWLATWEMLSPSDKRDFEELGISPKNFGGNKLKA